LISVPVEHVGLIHADSPQAISGDGSGEGSGYFCVLPGGNVFRDNVLYRLRKFNSDFCVPVSQREGAGEGSKEGRREEGIGRREGQGDSGKRKTAKGRKAEEVQAKGRQGGGGQGKAKGRCQGTAEGGGAGQGKAKGGGGQGRVKEQVVHTFLHFKQNSVYLVFNVDNNFGAIRKLGLKN
jgi:hypothetical protein